MTSHPSESLAFSPIKIFFRSCKGSFPTFWTRSGGLARPYFSLSLNFWDSC